MEACPTSRRLPYYPWVDWPIFGVLQRARPMHAECASQSLTKIPASPVAIAVDDADFIIAEAVNAIFIEQEERVINKKLSHAFTLEIENISSRPGFVGEKERVPVLWRSIFRTNLTIKEPQTFSSETAAGMVEDKV